MSEASNVTVTITAEVKTNLCDLLLVVADGSIYTAKAPPGKAKVGDMVEILPAPKDMIVGFVDDVLTTEEFSDLYCFIGRMANIWKARVIYNKGYVDSQVRDDAI